MELTAQMDAGKAGFPLMLGIKLLWNCSSALPGRMRGREGLQAAG